MVRLSSYSILSEPLPGGGYALMNGCTGAVDLISVEVAQIISNVISPESSLDAYIPDELLGADLIESFLERGHLTKISHDLEREHVKSLAQLLHDEGKKIPHFLIVPNMDCNYRCSYCFERPLQNNLGSATAEVSHAKGNVVMGSAQVEAVYQSIETILSESDRQIGGLITLYGGEPLDADNKEIVFKIVQTGIDKGFFFSAITNGHNLDSFLPLLGSGKIIAVQVSIDGPKHIHDKRRISLNKDSSFDRIVNNVNLALAKTDVEIQIRVHVDPSNIQLFDETLEIFASHGWLNHPNILIYANTVYEKEKSGVVNARMDNDAIIQHLKAIATPYNNVSISAPYVNASQTLLAALTGNQPYRLHLTWLLTLA